MNLPARLMHKRRPVVAGRHYLSLLLLGLLLSITAVSQVLIWALHNAQQAFEQEAVVTSEVINQRLKDNEAVLGGLAALHHAVDDVDYDQLSLFARQMLDSYPHILAIHNLLRVEQAGLPAFEARMREQGFINYRVTEYHPGQSIPWSPVAKRPVYFPVIFIAPLDPLPLQALGFDAYSDDNLHRAIDAAITGGEVSASAPYALPQGGRGYTLFKAVYTGEYVAGNQQEQYAQARRLVSLLIRADRLITPDDLHAPNIRVVLTQQGENETELPLTELRPAAETPSRFMVLLSPFVRDFEYTRTLNNADRKLHLRISKPVTPEALRLDLITVALLAVLLILVVLHMRQRFSHERHARDEALYQQQEQAAVTLHAIGDAVITTDIGGRVQQMNDTAERLTGWTLKDAQGRAVKEVFTIADEGAGEPLDPVAKCLQNGKALRLGRAVRLSSRENQNFMVEVIVSPIRNREGKLVSAILVFHDVSKEREMRDHIKYQASHDLLTGLVDRGEFQRLLDLALLSTREGERHHAMCFMDIDHFKVINDTCGHVAGDELLVQLSALLLSSMRSDDVLARLGGDEFGVLFYDCPLEYAIEKADSLRRVVEDVRFVWEGRTFDVGFGIGVVAVDKDSGSMMDVLRAADAACYTAKSRGRNQIFVYQVDDPELVKLRGEMRWVTRIGDALRNHQFRLYYQTIQPIQTPEPDVFHCELLMRTEDENHELVSPDAFIPTAERYKLVSDIDRWVINTALPRIAELDAQAAPGKTNLYGINLSGQSLNDPGFHNYVAELITRYKVNPKSICFEITETAEIGDLDLAIRFMDKMKALGCAFALDDFGTGVSSYTYLKRFPLDYVKIDGSFIRNMVNNPVDAAMVESVIHIARVMGIKTIAEFVEDQAILDKLKELGVDYAQGYGIARPAPLEKESVIS